jgi:S1-C subfamily serine protease
LRDSCSSQRLKQPGALLQPARCISGPRIIVRVNRQRVTNPGDISRAVVTSAPGQKIEFEVLRGSRSLVIRLILPKMLHL